MGKIVDPLATGIGAYPLLIMPDGSTHPLFNSTPGQRITPEGWIYSTSGSTYQVTLTNGMKYLFDELQEGAGYRDYNFKPVVQCTRIEDVHGNGIDILYSSVETIAPYYRSRIESISFDDASDDRAVEFTWTKSRNYRTGAIIETRSNGAASAKQFNFRFTGTERELFFWNFVMYFSPTYFF